MINLSDPPSGPKLLFLNDDDQIDFLKSVVGKNYTQFITDFYHDKFNGSGSFLTYAVTGKYVIASVSHIHDADEFFNYLDSTGLKEFYREFDITKYIDTAQQTNVAEQTVVSEQVNESEQDMH